MKSRTFTMTVTMDNAAFHDDGPDDVSELVRIIKATADKVARCQDEGVCVDYNGNKVGSFSIDSEGEDDDEDVEDNDLDEDSEEE